MEREINLAEMQQITTVILREFDRFCNENNLTYFVGYGTLLGAVRHGGFIPWDDDIDILMPRADYERLKDFSYIDSGKRYILTGAHNREGWPYAFSKCIDSSTELDETRFNSGTIGVYIDIFPLDGMPSGKVARKLRLKHIYLWHYLLNTLQKKDLSGGGLKSAVKKLMRPFAKRLGTKKIIDKLERLAQKNPFESSEWAGSQMICVYGERECMRREWFVGRERHVFGDIEVWIPSEYDKILTALYHDYMQLPPKEQRVARHTYMVKFKD